MIPYSISPLAKKDIDEIWDYIARDNVSAADRIIVLFEHKFLLLASQPLVGESRDELQAGIRSFSVGNYVIFYHPVKNSIKIARVIHGSRDIDMQF